MPGTGGKNPLQRVRRSGPRTRRRYILRRKETQVSPRICGRAWVWVGGVRGSAASGGWVISGGVFFFRRWVSRFGETLSDNRARWLRCLLMRADMLATRTAASNREFAVKSVTESRRGRLPPSRPKASSHRAVWLLMTAGLRCYSASLRSVSLFDPESQGVNSGWGKKPAR